MDEKRYELGKVSCVFTLVRRDTQFILVSASRRMQPSTLATIIKL